MNDLFNITLENCEYLGNSASPISLTLYSYQIGKIISFFSGSNLSDIWSQTIEQITVASNYSDDHFLFDLILNNNSYLFNGSTDQIYESIVRNYYAGIPISYYSGSVVDNINPLTIEDLILQYVG